MDWLIVIPARLNSTRLQEKALIDINGQTMIQRTYNCALNAVKDRNKIIIATDSYKIYKHARGFNAKVEITPNSCLTGTDRVFEIAKKYEASQYINLQGDEPIFPPEVIEYFIREAQKNKSIVHTAVKEILNKEQFLNKSIPKMVFSKSRKLLYSSRAPIPFNKSGTFQKAYKHICIYAYNKKHLKKFNSSEKSFFEKIEDLEINRYLENNIEVNCIEVKKSGVAVDTLYDLNKVKEILQ